MTEIVPPAPSRSLPLTAGIAMLLAAWLVSGIELWRANTLPGGAVRLAFLIFFLLQVPVLVLIHEFGHYGMARLLGWRVPVFIWGSLTIRLTPLRVSYGAAPFGQRVAGAIIAVPPLGPVHRSRWIAIILSGPLASLVCGMSGAVLSVLARYHPHAADAFAILAVLGLADAVLNLLPIRHCCDGWQILNLLRGADVERAAHYVRLCEQEVNGIRPRQWPRDLITAMRIENMWSGSEDAALYVYAVDLDRGDIASARAALDLAGPHPAVQAEKAFLAAFFDNDAASASALLRNLPAHRLQHTIGYWRAAAAVAMAAGQTGAARDAIRRGRILCQQSVYATAFDHDWFDAIERRLTEQV